MFWTTETWKNVTQKQWESDGNKEKKDVKELKKINKWKKNPQTSLIEGRKMSNKHKKLIEKRETERERPREREKEREKDR